MRCSRENAVIHLPEDFDPNSRRVGSNFKTVQAMSAEKDATLYTTIPFALSVTTLTVRQDVSGNVR